MTRLTAILALTACLAAAEGVQWVEHQLDSRFGGGSTRQARLDGNRRCILEMR